jgi:hypothetical protein
MLDIKAEGDGFRKARNMIARKSTLKERLFSGDEEGGVTEEGSGHRRLIKLGASMTKALAISICHVLITMYKTSTTNLEI